MKKIKMNLNRRKFLKFVLIGTGVLAIGKILGFSWASQVQAWTEPTQPPPGGNVDPPINTGSAWQVKRGGIELNNAGEHVHGLIVRNGNVGIGGIGTALPAARLHVEGQVRITGGSPAAGRVLTSDATGLATWGTVPPGTTPIRGIIMYSGPWNFDATGLGTGTLVGWALCNGNNGTPNIGGRFVRGATTSENLNRQGGSGSHYHEVSHLHTVNPPATDTDRGHEWAGEGPRGDWFFAGSHHHRVNISEFNSGTTNAETNSINHLPYYHRLAYIMRIS